MHTHSIHIRIHIAHTYAYCICDFSTFPGSDPGQIPGSDPGSGSRQNVFPCFWPVIDTAEILSLGGDPIDAQNADKTL